MKALDSRYRSQQPGALVRSRVRFRSGGVRLGKELRPASIKFRSSVLEVCMRMYAL